ncbi:MAG: tetratricopeptide repeat protein [Gemmatimonadetes bacterium]|jgi:tetratricopeptide (TPR) repeat protein|nr:tetratricopeptide repeat protein [Gemmatimonadota bacterium]
MRFRKFSSPSFIAVASLLLSSFLSPAEAAKEVKLARTIPSEVNLSNVKRIAVTPLSSDPRGRITNTLGARLQATGQFEILERSQLDALLAEHNFSISGMVDESSAVEMGQILGVEALVYGSVNVFRVYDEGTREKLKIKTGEETYTDKKGKKKTRSVYADIMAPGTIRRGELDLTVKIVSVESGLIVAQQNQRQTFEKTKINHAQASQTKLPGKGEIEKQLIDDALDAVCRYVAPYRVEEEVRWDGQCSGEDCDQAFSFLELGMFDEATQILDDKVKKAVQNVKNRKKYLAKDKKYAALYYNLGLIAELKGDTARARECYTEALKLRIKEPAEKQKKALERVKGDIAAWEAYNVQVGP